MQQDDFAVLILSHGRPNRVDTVKSLRRAGYTGKIYIVIDNEDDAADEYYRNYGDAVIMFDKAAIAETFDEGDNFGDRRAVIYARNACFDIAEKIGLRYFMQLDDDYVRFDYEVDETRRSAAIKNLDAIFSALLRFYASVDVKSIAMAQGGDFIGGIKRNTKRQRDHWRKCMNTFLCSTSRRFNFVGRINEDVNTYTWYQSLGNLFLTHPLTAIRQRATQSNSGGMTELYLDSGTYIKSFYTVMYHPSGAIITMMQSHHRRLHHQVRWDYTAPCILRETHRKPVTQD